MFRWLTIVLMLVAFPVAARAQGKAKKPAPQVLVKNVRIFDGKSEKLTAANLLVEGHLIKTISTGAIEARADADVIDGGGRVLMPGLIDMHSHIGLQEGLLEGRDDWDAFAMGAMTAYVMVGYLKQGFT